ncbi:MAG: monovalent cation/H(+) antiporter subunit G [Akkermansiaceae bacterium]
MKDILIAIFALLGSAAVLLAAVGLLRFPDFFTRTHAATKASAFGIGALLVAVCMEFPEWNVIAKSLFALVALFLTLPVASQALADAARGDDDAQ